MDRDEVIKKLIEELSLTRMAMAQTICNLQREDRCLGLKAIAHNWLARARQMPRAEWLAGTKALIHYCRVSRTDSAKEMVEMLQPMEQRYQEYSDKFRGVYWRKGRKLEETYRRGIENLRGEFIPYPTAEQNQFPPWNKGGISGYRLFIEAWKSKLAEVPKWLRNPN